MAEELGSLPLTLFCYDRIDSTSSQARRHVLEEGGDAPALFVAACQTEGRGRMGRSFYSPEGTGVYLSLLVPVEGSGTHGVTWTCGAAVAVARAIWQLTGIETGIKWVNDLYHRERKVCGILAESFSHGGRSYVILGVGVNLCTAEFPTELRAVAGSLVAENTEIKEQLTARIAKELYHLVTEESSADWIEAYRARSLVLGRSVRYWVNQQERQGVAVAIEEDGALRIRREDGAEERLFSGEITLRLDTTNFEERQTNE